MEIPDAGATLEMFDEQPRKKIKRNRQDPNLPRDCYEVPRNDDGTPILPITLSTSLVVQSLGRILPEKGYFQIRYLFPVGYRSIKNYLSYKQPSERIWYVNEIVKGKNGPIFRVTAPDAPDEAAEHANASGAWGEILRRVDYARNGSKRKFTAVSGPEQFGFVNPTIARLLQALPRVKRCDGYRTQSYNVIGSILDKKVVRRRVEEEEEELMMGGTVLNSSDDEVEKEKEKWTSVYCDEERWIIDT